MTKKLVAIVGAGPSGLFASYLLLKAGFKVSLFEKESGAAKKYLVAGSSGLNITNDKEINEFVSKYYPSPSIVTESVRSFPPQEIVKFYEEELSQEVFTGSTGHIFPKEMKTGKTLLKWMEILKSFEGFSLHKNSKLIGLSSNSISIEVEGKIETVKVDYFIYSLGGASWSKTGSSGDWINNFKAAGINCNQFTPQNCGYQIKWSDFFKANIESFPLKNITLKVDNLEHRGEVLINKNGIEGQLIYRLTHKLAHDFKEKSKILITLDLCPDMNHDQIIGKLKKVNKKASLSNRLRKALAFDKERVLLLSEFRDKIDLNNPVTTTELIKDLPLLLNSPNPIDEAISTSGGIDLSELSESFELKRFPNHFCIGEMVDWSAPTGGYLLTACMSMAHKSAASIAQRN